MNAPDLPKPTQAAPSDQALVSLRKILKAVDSSARALARETSLTPSQLVVLGELASRSSAQPGELARAAGLTQATISILLDRLQARGLIQRTKGEKDRRTVLVQITPEGKAILSGAPDLLQESFGARFGALPDWEQAYINAALARLVSLLGAENIQAAPVLDVGAITELP